MKVYIDKCDLMDMLYRSDIDSKEEIADIIDRAPSVNISETRYGVGYSDGREAQSKFYAAEKEAIRHAINKLDYMLCIINDTGGTIQYSDMNAINECIAVIKDLCKKKS